MVGCAHLEQLILQVPERLFWQGLECDGTANEAMPRLCADEQTKCQQMRRGDGRREKLLEELEADSRRDELLPGARGRGGHFGRLKRVWI